MELEQLLENPKCLVVVNHSGGKDSQAMYLTVKDLVPANRLIVIHAHLGHIEWPDIIEHIQNTTEHQVWIATAKKNLFDMARHRKMWPSPQNRQCTSDLKRNPINSLIKAYCNENGFSIVLNCIGLRAQESKKRAEKEVFRQVHGESNTKRTWFEWLPIHNLSTREVFDCISKNGQQPHWAYKAGMTRLSCCFCIMSSKQDLKTAARLRPELYKEYLELEREINHALIMPSGKGRPLWLSEIVEDGQTSLF